MRAEQQIRFDDIADKEPGDFGLYQALQTGNTYIDKLLSYGGRRIVVPARYLQGTQDYSEYSPTKTSRIDKILEKYGSEYIDQHPLITCALFHKNFCDIAIIDGHHRKRRGPLYGINEFSSLVVPPSALMYLINDLQGSVVISEDEIVEYYSNAIIKAKESFLHRNWSGLNRKGPGILGQSVMGVSTIDDLISMFSCNHN